MERELELAKLLATKQTDSEVREYIRRYFNGEFQNTLSPRSNLDAFSTVNQNFNFIQTIGEQNDIPSEIKILLGKFKLTKEEANEYVDIVRNFNSLCKKYGKDNVDLDIYNRAYEAKEKLYQSTYLTIIKEINNHKSKPSIISQFDIFSSALIKVGELIDTEFNASRSSFNTYINYMIPNIVSGIVDKESHIINAPEYFRQDERKVYKSEKSLRDEGKELTAEEISKKAKIKKLNVENVKQFSSQYVDLDDKLSSNDEDDKTYLDIITSNDLTPEEYDELETNREQAIMMLNRVLNPRQVKVVTTCNILFNYPAPKFTEVYKELGYSNGDSLGVTYRRCLNEIKKSKYATRLEEIGFDLGGKNQ